MYRTIAGALLLAVHSITGTAAAHQTAQRSARTAALLFNLREDVGERQNLIGQRPDVARRLRALLDAWTTDVDGEATSTVR